MSAHKSPFTDDININTNTNTKGSQSTAADTAFSRSRSPSPSMFNSLKKKLSRKGSNPFTKGDDTTTSRAVTSTSGHLAAPHNANNPFISANAAAAAANNEAPPAYSASPVAAPQTQSTNIPIDARSSSDDPYAFLKSFDTIFLIDDSGSMAGRSWRETQRALETITPICTERDADGIDIYFLNHPDSDFYKNVTSSGTVIEIFQNVRPGGGTPTGQKLEKILDPYLKQFSRNKSTKPINIIVITDGEPSDDVESPIIKAAKALDKMDAPAWQVGIQFFQVGREPGAREALKELDDGLAEIAGGELRDIVDTVPFLGDGNAELNAKGILKVVLGSVTRRLDRRSNEIYQRS